jgi:hypothetical protein
LELDGAEDHGDASTAVTDTAGERELVDELRARVEDAGKGEEDDPKEGVVFMHAAIAARDHNFGGLPVADEALRTSIEEGLCVLRLRARLEDLLVVEDDGAVAGWKVLSVIGFVALFALRAVLVDLFELEPWGIVRIMD